MARVLFWFLLLAAAAVAVALLARISDGYALFVAPPYRIEMSINFLLVVLVGGFFTLYAIFRLVSRALALPAEVRVMRRRQHLEHARVAHDAAVVALLEGRYRRARQRAEEALALPEGSGLAALIAARAAMATGDYAEAEAMLARNDVQGTQFAVPRLMLAAELELEQGRPTEALARLAALRKEAGLHTAALRLELKALQAAGRHGEVAPIVGELVKRKVYSAEEGELLRAAAHAGELESLTHDPSGFRAYWNRLAEHEQRQPRVARAAARGFLVLGGDREAADLLARALDEHWDPELAVLFAQSRPQDALRQLEQAEQWLLEHNGDASLLYALGLLCERRELWGKAQTYLEASLALVPSWRTEIALGELFVRTGREKDANAHLASALRLALAELERNTHTVDAPPGA